MIYGGSFNTWKNDLLEDKPKKDKIDFKFNTRQNPINLLQISKMNVKNYMDLLFKIIQH